MGVERDLRDITPNVGNTTQFIFKEQPAFGEYGGIDVNPIVVAANGNISGGDFPKIQGVPSAVDLALLGSLIDPGVFTGTRARVDGYPGILRGEGGVVLGGSPKLGYSIFRMLFQDKNPSYHVLGGGGVTIPAEKSVVDAQALPGIEAKTVAEDLASTKNPVRLTVTPKSGSASTVNVVDAEDLAGASAKAIDNNLSAYDTPFTLKVAPSNAGELSDDAVPATVVIQGTDPRGRIQTDILEFPDGSKTTAQTTSKAFMQVTEVTATGWSAGTVTISVSLVAAVTLGRDIEFAKVRIAGTDAQDRKFAETLTFTEETKSAAQTTKRYFKTVEGVTSSGWIGGAIDIKGRDKAVRVTIKPQDEKILCYWLGELTRGLIPEVIYNMLMSQLTIQISREEVMRYACVFNFTDSDHQTNLAGDTGAMARRSDASALEFPVDDFFIGYQADITIDGVRLAMREATVVINQQYTASDVLSGEPTDESPPVGGTRLVTLTGNVRYATENDYNRNFRENVKFSNVQVRFRNKLRGGFPAQFRLRGGRGELNANPVATFSDGGEILQPIELNLLPTKFGASDDIIAILDIPELSRGRIYS